MFIFVILISLSILMVAHMLSMAKLFWNDENPILKNTIVKNRINIVMYIG